MAASLWQARTSLVVHTARLFSYQGPDGLNITRMSGGPAGMPFAPSWEILRPALAEFRKARAQRQLGAMDAASKQNRELFAAEIERQAWERYVPLFMHEMERSFDEHPAAWRDLLARELVVVECYCADPAFCHRTLLARDIVAVLGADYRGEIAPAVTLRDRKPSKQGSLF